MGKGLIELLISLLVAFSLSFFHDDIIVASFFLQYVGVDLLEHLDHPLGVVLELAFVIFTLLVDEVNEPFDQFVKLLVERPDLVLRFFLEDFADDFAIQPLLAVTDLATEDNLLPSLVGLARVVALEDLRVRLLVPQLKQLGPRVVLQRVKVCVNLDVGHDQLLQHSPGDIDRL